MAVASYIAAGLNFIVGLLALVLARKLRWEAAVESVRGWKVANSGILLAIAAFRTYGAGSGGGVDTHPVADFGSDGVYVLDYFGRLPDRDRRWEHGGRVVGSEAR